MNDSARSATAVVEQLIASGVHHVVLCPGSRSAPLAYALAAAAQRIQVHVRIDERAAGFTALGLSRGSQLSNASVPSPAAVVVTSGTAVANLHPAALEADHAGVPLLLITADRPDRLRGSWANQTSAHQAGLFGGAVRSRADLLTPQDDWAAVVADAVRVSRGGEHRPGPVHLNLAFEEPLTPDGSVDEPVATVPAVAPSASEPAPEPAPRVVLPVGPRTVVVAGDCGGSQARELAEAAGWPLLAEPTSGARGGPAAVAAPALLLDVLGPAVQRAVVFGRPTLSRSVAALLARPDIAVVVVGGHPDDPLPTRSVTRVLGSVEVTGIDDPSWLQRWQAAGTPAQRGVDGVLDAGPLVGPLVAREVAAALSPGEVLVCAASNPIRDLDIAATPRADTLRAVANRGLSGIDGTLSTAVGIALATGAATRVLIGDLAFLHDLNGLLIGPTEMRPDLQVVVLNDDGGGIFSLVEHGEPHRSTAVFERMFATPHGADLAALCGGVGATHRSVADLAQLRAALRNPRPGIDVVEVRAGRDGLRALHASLESAVAVAAGAQGDYSGDMTDTGQNSPTHNQTTQGRHVRTPEGADPRVTPEVEDIDAVAATGPKGRDAEATPDQTDPVGHLHDPAPGAQPRG